MSMARPMYSRTPSMANYGTTFTISPIGVKSFKAPTSFQQYISKKIAVIILDLEFHTHHDTVSLSSKNAGLVSMYNLILDKFWMWSTDLR